MEWPPHRSPSRRRDALVPGPQKIIDVRGHWFRFDDRDGLSLDERIRARPRRMLSDKECKLVYAAISGKNVIPLS